MLANLNISLCPSWSQEEFVVVVVPVELASLPLNNEKEKLQNTDFVGIWYEKTLVVSKVYCVLKWKVN